MKQEANSVALSESGYLPVRSVPSDADAGCAQVTRETTGHIFQCALRKTVSSVSAMVFMEDSVRAAAMARESGIDAGLHLNLTTPFSARNCPARLQEHQREVAGYLL